MGSFGENFDFNLRRDHQKNLYEHPDYGSVDEKSLSLCPDKMVEKIQDKKG